MNDDGLNPKDLAADFVSPKVQFSNFVPCPTCPDHDWCGSNGCWWDCDQGEP